MAYYTMVFSRPASPNVAEWYLSCTKQAEAFLGKFSTKIFDKYTDCAWETEKDYWKNLKKFCLNWQKKPDFALEKWRKMSKCLPFYL